MRASFDVRYLDRRGYATPTVQPKGDSSGGRFVSRHTTERNVCARL